MNKKETKFSSKCSSFVKEKTIFNGLWWENLFSIAMIHHWFKICINNSLVHSKSFEDLVTFSFILIFRFFFFYNDCYSNNRRCLLSTIFSTEMRTIKLLIQPLWQRERRNKNKHKLYTSEIHLSNFAQHKESPEANSPSK